MRYVGVDLASTEVRAIELDKKLRDGFFTIKRIGTAPIAEDQEEIAVKADGTIAKPVLVADALQRALKGNGMPVRKVVVPVRATVAVELVALPAGMKKSAHYEEALRSSSLRMWARGNERRFTQKTARLSWRIIESFETPEGEKKELLSVTAVAPDAVSTVEQVIELAGVDPLAIDIVPTCLMRSMVRSVPDDHSISAIIDIGATSTDILVRRGPHVRFFTTLDWGGMKITSELMQVSGADFAEAEQRKRFLQLPDQATSTADADDPLAGFGFDTFALDTTQSSPEEALADAVDQLIDNIEAALEQDRKDHRGAPIKAVVLTGAGSRVRGFKERLARKLGVPVSTGRPWATASGVDSLGDLEAIAAPSARNARLASFSVAIGAASLGMSGGTPMMDAQ